MVAVFHRPGLHAGLDYGLLFSVHEAGFKLFLHTTVFTSYFISHSCSCSSLRIRPDTTCAVDWALKTNSLSSICPLGSGGRL